MSDSLPSNIDNYSSLPPLSLNTEIPSDEETHHEEAEGALLVDTDLGLHDQKEGQNVMNKIDADGAIPHNDGSGEDLLAQKSKEIELYQDIIHDLHQQQENHSSLQLVQSIDKIIQNTKSKKHASNGASYEPYSSFRAKGNIQISRYLTDDILEYKCSERISDFYHYLDKNFAIQHNNGQILDDTKCDEVIVSLNLTDRQSRQKLYCVLQRIDPNKSKIFKYRMLDQVFTAFAARLSGRKLPKSSIDQFQIQQQMHRITAYLKSTNNIANILRCKWSKIQVFKKNTNTERTVHHITPAKLNEIIRNYILRYNTKIIPIVMFGDNKKHWIEYIMVIDTYSLGSIGVSLRYDEGGNVYISSLHLDWTAIRLQHEIVSAAHMKECECFAGITPVIDDIHVGNPDDVENRIKSYKARYEMAAEVLRKVQDPSYKFGHRETRDDVVNEMMFDRLHNVKDHAYKYVDSVPSKRKEGTFSEPPPPPHSATNSKIVADVPTNSPLTKSNVDTPSAEEHDAKDDYIEAETSKSDGINDPDLCISITNDINIPSEKHNNDTLDVIAKAKQDITELKRGNRKKNEIIKEQKSEIERLKQQIQELRINTNYPPLPLSEFIDLDDIKINGLNDRDQDLDKLMAQHGIDVGSMSDCSLDSIDIDNILDKVCTKCPAGYGGQNNNHHGYGNNDFHEDKNNNNQSNFSRNKRSNRQNRDNGNNNNNDDHKDGNDNDKFHHNPYHHKRCNHLHECAECNQLLIQKDYEMMLLHERIRNLQREVIPDINGKKAFRPKFKPKPEPSNPKSYEPIQPPRAKGYVEVPRNLTNKTLAVTAVEGMFNWFDYMDKTISLQLHDQEIGNPNDDEKKCDDIDIVINLDLYHRQTKLPLFVKIQKIYNHKTFVYRMEDKLFTASDLQSYSLPTSSRDKFEIKKEMNQIIDFLEDQENIDKLFKNCKWNKIPLHKAKKKKNKQRMVFSITEQELRKTAKLHLSLYGIRLIPILMFTNHGHHIEYILLIDSSKFGAIGFSVTLDPSNHPKICGVHVDWDRIKLAHQAILPQHANECQCLSGFKEMHIVDEFYVRNPDHYDNIIKDKQKRYDALLEKLFSIKAKMQKIVNDPQTKEKVYHSPLSSNVNREIQENIPSSQSSQNSVNNYNSSDSSPSSLNSFSVH